MKELKSLSLLICAAIVFNSCQKETVDVLENTQQKPTTSFLNYIKNNSFASKFQNTAAKKSQTSQWRIADEELEAVAEFYLNDAESFNCSGTLTTEDFSNININEDIIEMYDINGILDENTSYGNEEMMYIEPGDIVNGIQFSTAQEYNWIFVSSDFEELENLNIQDNAFFNMSAAPLEIAFESNNITAITADLIVFNYGTTVVYAVDSEENYLGHIIINPNNGEFEEEEMIEFTNELLQIKSPVPIKKLYMYTNDYIYFAPNFLGFDAISFGECISDADNDGIMDNEDPYPNSNLSETLFINDFNTYITNSFTRKKGVTMADEMDNLILQINAQYNGSNYNELHKKFVSEVAKLSYYWYKSRLITSRERSKISSYAWSSNIPYFENI